MPVPVLTQTTEQHIPESILASLLYMLHLAATQSGHVPDSRLAQQISSRLELLASRPETPEMLRQVCDDLSDEWQPLLDRSLFWNQKQAALLAPQIVMHRLHQGA